MDAIRDLPARRHAPFIPPPALSSGDSGSNAGSGAPLPARDRFTSSGLTTELLRGKLRVAKGRYELQGPAPVEGGSPVDGASVIHGDADLQKKILIISRLLAPDSGCEERLCETLGMLEGVETSEKPAESVIAEVREVNIEASISVQTVNLQGDGETMAIRVEEGVFRMEATLQQGDPLILDLAGDGIDLRSADEGVRFDLLGTGEAVQTAFVRGDDALLFIDYNGDGTVSDGIELFGDQTGAANGFAELAQHDKNGDGVIDVRDPVFGQLRLFQDLNGNGRGEADETQTLAEAAVRALRLTYQATHQDDGKGNTLTEAGSFERADGSTGLLADLRLGYYA